MQASAASGAGGGGGSGDGGGGGKRPWLAADEAGVEWGRLVDWEKLPAVVLRQYVEALLKAVGKRQPDKCTRRLTDGEVNPWASLKDAAGCQWGMCEFLRRLHRRGAITDADFPEWAQEAEVVEARDRKRLRWVLQDPVSGAEVVKPQGGLARGLQGILGMLERTEPAVVQPPTPQPPHVAVVEASGLDLDIIQVGAAACI